MFVPTRSSCDPRLQERLSFMKNLEARLPRSQVLSSPPIVVNGAFDPLPCNTIGKAANVFCKSCGSNRLEYHENAGLK
jgi:hypothetical protein